MTEGLSHLKHFANCAWTKPTHVAALDLICGLRLDLAEAGLMRYDSSCAVFRATRLLDDAVSRLLDDAVDALPLGSDDYDY